MYPIRIGMKTQVEINGKKFIMRILERNKFDLNQPGYTCQCDSDSSEIEDNPTNAITSLYRQIFKTQTKISGSMVMGFDKDSIFTELLQDIEFCPYSISIADKLTIMGFSLGASKKESWLGAGEEYMASFIHIFRKERCIFVQKFIKNKSIVEVWNNNSTKISHYEGSLPVEWESGGNIIEINTILTNLYPKNYQFSNREMQAWSSMLKAASCTDITPFNSEVSPVIVFYN
ncbi:hypothetical protein RhiirA4_455721 [Rhizophagus irregularis]|uniref:Uncharacterized protein n=1 Tax=Rhizophagus irregularis TaxID=588596 RepID=A0A2I1G5S4_9GLOM|nr:hypothetical protein RhiirA4_455721 [Rhizophagus irregularis]